MAKNPTNPRGKLFCFVLYPEDNEEHKRVLDTLKTNYMILGINHCRDVWHKYDDKFEEGEHYEGELKKAHHHVIVKFENARYQQALAKELSCEPNLLRKIGSFRSMVIYLTHRDYPQKAQYKPDEFYGLLLGDAMKCLGDDSPDVQLLEIVSYLENLNRYMSYTEFIKFCCTYGYTSTLKRFGPQIERVFNEQQGKYHAQQYENKIRKR